MVARALRAYRGTVTGNPNGFGLVESILLFGVLSATILASLQLIQKNFDQVTRMNADLELQILDAELRRAVSSPEACQAFLGQEAHYFRPIKKNLTNLNFPSRMVRPGTDPQANYGRSLRIESAVYEGSMPADPNDPNSFASGNVFLNIKKLSKNSGSSIVKKFRISIRTQYVDGQDHMITECQGMMSADFAEACRNRGGHIAPYSDFPYGTPQHSAAQPSANGRYSGREVCDTRAKSCEMLGGRYDSSEPEHYKRCKLGKDLCFAMGGSFVTDPEPHCDYCAKYGKTFNIGLSKCI